MSDGMTRAEAISIAATVPERTPIYVTETPDGYAATWNGRTFEATNPFALDSSLSYAGAPQPRDLYLIAPEATDDTR